MTVLAVRWPLALAGLALLAILVVVAGLLGRNQRHRTIEVIILAVVPLLTESLVALALHLVDDASGAAMVVGDLLQVGLVQEVPQLAQLDVLRHTFPRRQAVLGN